MAKSSSPSYRQVRKREAEREKREQAEKSLEKRRENAVSAVDSEVIDEVRRAGESGEAVFPILPGDSFRGYETNSSSSGGWNRKWTPEKRAAAVNEVAIRMAAGESISDILGQGRDKERLPGKETFYAWIFGLGDEYVYRVFELAQKMRVQGFVDELIEISDMAREADDVAEVKGAELAVNTRQWIASKIMPWLYGRSETGGSGITVNISTNLDGEDRPIEGDAYRVEVKDAGEQ